MRKKKVFAVALAVTVALVLLVMPAMAASNVVLCRVDIGSETASHWAAMSGWGPVEPATSGGNWGGFGKTGENCRVIWDVSDDDRSAEIVLDRSEARGAATAIRMRHLDGLADDSFDVYVKDVHGSWILIGSWAGSPGSENWQTHEYTLPDDEDFARGRDVEVKLAATGPKWSGFNTYGQVAFDWIELVGNGRNGS